MARIREYNQEIGAGADIGGRRAQAGDVFALGPELARSVNHATDVLQETADRQEVSDVQAKLAKARADWTVTLQERAQSTSPGDATFAGKFNEDFGKYMQGLEGNLQTRAGQQAFQVGAAQLSAHFVEKAGVYQAQAMGEKAKQDYLVSLNSYRNVLLSDPTQFKDVAATASAALNDPSGIYAKMPAADREKLAQQTQQELALSAVQGLIQNGAPELAKRQLAGGQWDTFLDADKKAALNDKADVAIHAKDTAAERERLLAERARKDAQDSVMKDFLARIVDPKSNGGALSDREVLVNADLTAAQQQHVIDYKRARAKELATDAENRRHPLEVDRLHREMVAAADDPTKVFSIDNVRKAFAEQRISSPEETTLERIFYTMRDAGGNSFVRDMNTQLGTVSRMVAGSVEFTGRTAEAIDTVNRIREDAFQEVEQWRSEKKNPRELLNPRSKDYLFSPERLNTYIRSGRQAVAGEAQQIRGAQPLAAPRLAPGTVQGGYRFKGGDPAKRENWEKAP